MALSPMYVLKAGVTPFGSVYTVYNRHIIGIVTSIYLLAFKKYKPKYFQNQRRHLEYALPSKSRNKLHYPTYTVHTIKDTKNLELNL